MRIKEGFELREICGGTCDSVAWDGQYRFQQDYFAE